MGEDTNETPGVPAQLGGAPSAQPPELTEVPGGPLANDWPAWTGLAALAVALVLSAFAGLLVYIPALALGVKISSSHTPPGIELAGTVVQDVVFVLTAVWFARLGGRTFRSWQLGLRPTPARRAAGLVLLTIVAFLFFSLLWAVTFGSKEEKLLEQLGTNETALLLTLSALLTTVIAPICEEILFRGYVFAALSKWKGWVPAAVITGLLFGGVHAGSAPAVDLAPLAVLGFMLCLLYRRTGSLYPCIAAHSLNNSLAFGSLEKWGWQIPVLMVAALASIALLALLFRRIGLISEVPVAQMAVTTTAYNRL